MSVRALVLTVGALAIVSLAEPVVAGDPVYVPKYTYPVLEEIEAVRAAVAAERDSMRAAADAAHLAEQERRRQERLSLRIDWSDIKVPAGPKEFQTNWHFPPVPQYYTGTCWAFCSVSFMEAEAKRLHGQEIKLSEMWVVYWEYVEKARRFLREFGHSVVEEGSQDHGTLEIFKGYGAVPAAAYRGVLSADGRYDHTPLVKELKGYLQWVLDSESWDEEQNLTVVRTILDKHMGRPPESFQYAARSYTPRSFLGEVLQLNPDDYVNCVSRLESPRTSYYTYLELDVVDNWRRKDDYLNLPLHDFYDVIRKAVHEGYPVSLGGDVSEPGLDGKHDAAIIPAWDIPAKQIDQASREFRIYNKTTTDDHGVHVVGFKRHGGQDWFLIKDSNRSSRLGAYAGYYFYAGDYIKLKMLSFMVHRDLVAGLLP